MKNIQTTPVFYHNYYSDKRININRGGTRSGKTYNLLQLFLYWLLYGKIDEKKYFESGILSIVRRYGASLKGSVLRDFEELIDKWGVRDRIKINKSDRTYVVGQRVVEFIGADDQQKLRGTKRDILYCNEGNELDYENQFFQLMIRTTYKIFIDFNPDDEYIWINTELEQKRFHTDKDVKVIVSTYKDNPFLDDILVKEIERLKITNPKKWEIYGLGQYGKLEGIIYPDVEEIEKIPEGVDFLGYGLDFGYATSQTAVVEIYHSNGKIYLNEILYETGLGNKSIYERLIALGYKYPDIIVADSAEPKSIDELYSYGLNIVPAIKGGDSIRFGINFIKDNFKLYYTSQSVNLKKEFKTYTYQRDKNGNYVEIPIKDNDHLMDAMRYGITYLLDAKNFSSDNNLFIG